MSTDSTELTFVRCPSCKSLVPAVSTRCRMCGASLDSSVQSEEKEPPANKASRVRQRTMSGANSEELKQVREALKTKHGEKIDREELQSDAPDQLEDPLSAYLNEVEEGEPEESTGDDAAQAKDIFDEILEETEPKPSKEAAAPSESKQEAPSCATRDGCQRLLWRR